MFGILITKQTWKMIFFSACNFAKSVIFSVKMKLLLFKENENIEFESSNDKTNRVYPENPLNVFEKI